MKKFLIALSILLLIFTGCKSTPEKEDFNQAENVPVQNDSQNESSTTNETDAETETETDAETDAETENETETNAEIENEYSGDEFFDGSEV